ncbi:TfuA-like domain-containing protein (plasmid) [Rhizobium sp. N6212]|nr:TfuA-like domain-containing protein [Rhizobium sp. N6212]ANL00647.1 TfuA-like domain-containing protein [Rhizobium sp. N621]ANL06768.1 TfuA-like domain-containing protein [Rhizobium esperanzae]ANL12939.1 TfuA-like domain-containing protein [Rhizobium sp. N1341]ANM37612.1 TfuA-like domain-containing protein [Rhizobium sp. N871]ANM43762.1 TfuA-like domain-containing protein [Rhizobium sp. N741]
MRRPILPCDIVVFLGPTLSETEARTYLDAIYYPPVGCADVVRAVARHQPAAIVLIDGVFGELPAVRHQEILWAMARGVRVYGAASIGALRAAELAPEGMIGHGMIYRWYRRHPLADDADVTVPMAPAALGSRALGDALIDISLTLRKAERAGIIQRRLRDRLETLARAIHFSERSYSRLLAAAENNRCPANQLQALKTWLKIGATSRKRTDAVNLLTYLAGQKINRPNTPAPCEFELTESFANDMEYYNMLDSLLPKGT